MTLIVSQRLYQSTWYVIFHSHLSLAFISAQATLKPSQKHKFPASSDSGVKRQKHVSAAAQALSGVEDQLEDLGSVLCSFLAAETEGSALAAHAMPLTPQRK